MFINHEFKAYSTILKKHANQIKPVLYQLFEDAIIKSNSEVQFIQQISENVKSYLSSLSIPGLSITCRTEVIHKKPIVRKISAADGCELGDLLVVVKYHLPNGTVEAKSIIYQVKLTRRSSTSCDIDQKQLELLCDWPAFSFGLTSLGGPQVYQVMPNTIEFGSYMLELRRPNHGQYLRNNPNCYGVTPQALMVRECGPSNIQLNGLPYTRNDASNIFSQMVFEIGEHHCNASVNIFINALYRHIGLDPDPPDEFKDYWVETKADGFSVIEINVRRRWETTRSLIFLKRKER